MSIREISPELKIKAEIELNETPERMKDGISHLKEWIAKQPHLNARKDDQWLLNFLRCSKYNIQRAKERIDGFYVMRTLSPEFYANRDPYFPEIQDILERGIILPLPNTVQPDGPVIYLIRWCNADPNQNTLVNIIKTFGMIHDILCNESDNFSVSGFTVVHDFFDYNANYILQHTPTAVKKIVATVKNGHPVRHKGVLHCNVPQIMEQLYGLFKPFLTEKQKNRTKFYSKDHMEGLYKDIPINFFPKEYGGNAGSLEELTAMWKKKIESFSNWFKDDEQYRTDESLRPGKPKTCADVFGVEGSFMQLTVD